MGNNKRETTFFVPITMNSDETEVGTAHAAHRELPDDVVKAGVDCLSTLDLDQLFFRPSLQLRKEVVCAIYLAMAKQMFLSLHANHSPEL